MASDKKRPHVKIRRSRPEWQQIVTDFEESGLSAQEFCNHRQIAYSSFGKWRSLLQKGHRKPAQPTAFLEVTPLDPPVSHWDVELELGPGMYLRLRSRNS